jgi:pimeloyl-ACP methyl ester carboxylesterase
MAMECLEYGNRRFSYRVSGNGETVLLLHGSAGTHILWRRLTRAIESSYRVIAPDLLGYGLSVFPPEIGIFSLEDEIEPLCNILSGCDGLHIVGYSYGTVVALGLALQARCRISSLALIEPVCFGLLKDTDHADLYEEASAWRRCFETRMGHGDVLGAIEAFVNYWPSRITWEEMSDDVRRHFAGMAPKIPRDMKISFETRFSPALLRSLAIPTLLIYGGASLEPVRQTAIELNGLIGASTLAVFPDAMHDLPSSHPEALNSLLLQHIKTHRR